MDSVAEIRPIGESDVALSNEGSRTTSELHRWVEIANCYRNQLRKQHQDKPTSAAAPQAEHFQLYSLRLDDDARNDFDKQIRRASAKTKPSDLLVLICAASNFSEADRSRQRDLLSRALFKAGFEAPLIWSGRKVLVGENGASLVNRFLLSSALGAGPDQIPDVGAIEIASDQLVAMARHGDRPPPTDRNLRLSIVMPIDNERKKFNEVIERLLAKTIPGFDIEICTVERKSTDGTREDVLRYKDHPKVHILLEETPQGKGHAVRNGFQIATGYVILIQDADLEYDLNDYEEFLAPIAACEASVILGSRHPAGNSSWRLRRFSNQSGVSDLINVGHLFFTCFLTLVFRQSLRDPFTMYKVFRRDRINNVKFECNRFDFDHELVGKLVRNGFRPTGIDPHYESRSFREGKKVAFFRDPPTWIKACARHRFSRLHVWPA